MPVLNYTTSVSVEKTLGEIQAILAKHKAKSIMIDYDGGIPCALKFLMPTRFGDRAFRLPANLTAVHRVLLRQYDARKIDRRYSSEQQAGRVGWRILKDWLEAQLAVIETEMVTIDQVLLPYMTNTEGRTLYDLMEARHFALPAPEERTERGVG